MALSSNMNTTLFVIILVPLLLPHLTHTKFSEFDWNTLYDYIDVRVHSAEKRCPDVGGFKSQCRLASDCALWYDLVRITPGTACKLNKGHGICCPDLPRNNVNREPIKQANSRPNHKDLDGHVESRLNIASVNSVAAESSHSHLLLIVEKEAPRLLDAAIKAGQLQFSKMVETEQRLAKRHIVVVPGTDRALDSLWFKTTDESQKISLGALRGISTSTELVKRLRIPPEQTEFALNRIVIRDTYFSDTCPTDPICDEKAKKNPFRTSDGSCNNLQRSSWGKSRTQFRRLFVPVYADGVRQPRRAQNGGELPNVRLLSTSLAVTALSQGNDPNVKWSESENTYWVTQYGQFIDHDITSTVQSKLTTRLGEIQCCMEDGKHIDKDMLHPECLPIDIPKNDPFFSKLSPARRCMNFIRSAPARRSDCRLGYAEQMNDNTHLLDMSNVYGSDAKVARELRTHQKGSLNVTSQREFHSGHPVKHLDFLPSDEAEGTGISSCALSKGITGKDPPAHVKCFKAGDGRSSVTPNLAVTHTIFMRQHNRLVDLLADLNPHWNDERLYQEARRILTAQMQHITYNEWLPVVIGREKMQELGLLPLLKGFSRDYDENVNPSILNEFAAAAFRFGHSLVQGQNHLYDMKRKKTGSVQLRHHFFKTQSLYTPGNLDKFLVGLATQPDQKVDNVFTEELTNHLFEEDGKGYGMDLLSLNIQRGRDHGLPGYNSYRALCGLPRSKDFDGLIDLIPRQTVDKLKSLYASVEDVDLYIAGVSERPAKGAVIGPTFQCIIADQFLRLKRGDRYFYDLGGQSGSFTEKQLEEIRKTSFARLICDNSLVQLTQPLVFKSASTVNPIVDCKSTDSISHVSLQAWKEFPGKKGKKIEKTSSTLG